jgi:Rieske Fe-S protein
MNAESAVQIAATERKGRRGFFATMGGLAVAWLGAALYPVYRYLAPLPAPDPFGKEGRARVDKIAPADVAQPGAGKNGGYAGRGLIVFRAPDGRLRAFDSKCTHAGCNVGYEGTRLHCPCHGGVYDLEGKNVAGPPPRPLNELVVVEENGALYVSRKAGAAAGRG